MAQARTAEVEAKAKTVIDPEGDLVLQLGRTDVKAQLQVSSKVLGLASPVFAAMLSPRFSEGNQLAKGSLRPIPLPEDDPEAVTLLCNILHFRSNLIPTHIVFPLLEKLALLCDKYDTSRSVTPWSTLWLQSWLGSTTGEDQHARMLYISYAYNNHKAFYHASRSMLLAYDPAALSNTSAEGMQVPPDTLIPYLESARDKACKSLHNAIEIILMPTLGAPRTVSCTKPKPEYSIYSSSSRTKSTTCECTSCTVNRQLTPENHSPYSSLSTKPCFSATKIGAYVLELARLDLWPLSERIWKGNLGTVLDRLLLFQDFTPDTTGCNCTTCRVTFKDKLVVVSQKHRAQLMGLCLKCVKSGRISQAEENCQGISSCNLLDFGRPLAISKATPIYRLF